MTTRDERQARIDELRSWIEQQNDEFRDEGFPPDVQAAWDQNNAELREHERIMDELEQRDARLREMSTRQESREGGADPGTVTRRNAPAMISRMSEREVYDLRNLRVDPLNPEAGQLELVERARRAVEVSFFPHVDYLGGDQARAKGHVEKLLQRNTDEDWQSGSAILARRILATGSPAYKRAFTKALAASMRGIPAAANLNSEEQRAMSIATGSAGGFAVPYQLDSTIIPTSNYSVNPFRAICRTEQIAGTNEWRGVSSGGVTAAYAAEAAEASDNSPTIAQPTLTTVRAQCFVPVSIELTQDWGAIQTELAGLIQDAKDDLEASKFSTGTGTGEPTGLITAATNTVTGTGGAASFVVADLYKVEEALPPRFRPRAQWMANRFTYNKARQFDTAGGSGVWLQSLQPGLANRPTGNTGYDLIGYPANENTGMAAVLTTGSKIAVLGDPRYYCIVDRIGMDIEVIPHLFGGSQRPTGQRGFYAFWRNTANALSAAAFRVLVTA